MQLRKKQRRAVVVIRPPEKSSDNGLDDAPIFNDSLDIESIDDERLNDVPIAEEGLDDTSFTSSDELEDDPTIKYDQYFVNDDVKNIKLIDQIVAIEQQFRKETEGASKPIRKRSNSSINGDNLLANNLHIVPENNEYNGIEFVENDTEYTQYNEKEIQHIIKEEHVKGELNLDEIPALSNSCTYYYCCRVCDLKTVDHITYFDHLDLVHKLAYKSKQIKHLELEPILEDPNNFCQSCEKTYSSQSNYRLHLQYVHHMIFKPIKVSVDSSLLPGDVGSAFQCDACNIGYETKTAYYKHLNSRHQISSFGPNANPDLLPDMKHPYNYCRPCDKRFLNPNRFRNHLDYMHNIDLIRHPGLLPDWYNENYYCRSCELNLLSVKTFHNHCMEVHNCGAHGIIKEKDHNNKPVPPPQQQQQQKIVPKTTHLGPNPNLDLVPDPLDPNNHCITCDKQYDLKKNFWAHLRKIHDIRATVGEFTIPAEQKYHCSTCDKYFLTGAAYQSHVRWIHLTIQQPTIHDPNNYCCTCNINYESQSLYHLHLRNVHKIDIFSHFPETNNSIAVHDSSSPAPFRDYSINHHQPVSIGNFRNILPSNIHTNADNIPPVLDNAHATNIISNQGSSFINNRNNTIDLTDLTDDDDISVNSNADDTFPTPSTFTNNASLVKERTSIKFNAAANSNMIIEYIIPENDGRPKLKEYNDPNLPDPNDTTYYCRVCKTFKKTAHQHRSHCKRVHKMVLEPYVIPFPCPDAVIDLNDPNLFCARCNKICSPKSHFKNHMKRIHGIIFRTRSGARPSNYSQTSIQGSLI